MQVLVDTSIWSLALRKKTITAQEEALVRELGEIIEESRAKIIGPIRQEILSGISSPHAFEVLKKNLEAFEDLPITSQHYVRAAEMYNLCRKKGIQGSHIDYLICAVAEGYSLSIFTSDKDFEKCATCFPLELYILQS